MITMIAAVSTNGILGVDGHIPWMGKYSADMKRFKSLTTDGIVIMGSKTWHSMGARRLPNRYNVIVSSKSNDYESNESIIAWGNLHDAIQMSRSKHPDKKMWIIGGASLYSEGMSYVSVIDLTIIPEYIENDHTRDIVRFPWINPTKFELESKINGEQGLIHLKYKALDKIG